MALARFLCSLQEVVSMPQHLRKLGFLTEIQYQRQISIMNNFASNIENLGDALLVCVSGPDSGRLQLIG